MELSVKDLNITTPSITINSVKINNKQMTLAVFRQIDIGNISDCVLDLTKDILIWGRVNYKTAHKIKYKEDNNHINWILFEKNGFLYRDSIENLYNEISGYYAYYEPTIDEMIEKLDYSYRVWHKRHVEEYTNLLDIINCGNGQVFLKIKDGKYESKHKDNPINQCFDSIELAKEYFNKELKKCKEKLENNNSLKDFLNNYYDLKQLFIAV